MGRPSGSSRPARYNRKRAILIPTAAWARQCKPPSVQVVLLDSQWRNLGRAHAPPRRAERFDPEARRLEPGRKVRRAEVGLDHQMPDEFAPVGSVAPDARQEQRAPAHGAENEPVAIGLERRDKVRFAVGRNGARM